MPDEYASVYSLLVELGESQHQLVALQDICLAQSHEQSIL